MTNRDLAFEAKNLATVNRFGILSTHSISQPGYPFGSLVPYDISERASFVIYISLIAEHYKNLKAAPHASLCITNALGFEDAQAHARATVLLDFKEIPRTEQSIQQLSYESRFPGSVNHELAHNFVFMVGTPIKVRWIGGFGDIAWISAEKFCDSPTDPLAYHAPEILDHMNNDHPEALRDFTKAFGQVETKRCQMIGISRNDFQIVAYLKSGQKVVTIPFPTPVNTPEQVHQTMRAMLKSVRLAESDT